MQAWRNVSSASKAIMATLPQSCTFCSTRTTCELADLLGERRRDCEPVIATEGVPAGDVITLLGHKLYAVRTGVVKELWMQTPRRGRIVDFVFPGGLVGLDASLGFGQTQKAYAAVESATLCEMHCDARAVETSALFPQARLASELARRIVPVYALSWMIQTDAATRVAHYIVKVSRSLPPSLGPARRPLPNIPRTDIADYLGLRPESVSRALSQFRRAGWIRGKIDHLEVMDLEAIRALGEHAV